MFWEDRLYISVLWNFCICTFFSPFLISTRLGVYLCFGDSVWLCSDSNALQIVDRICYFYLAGS